MDFRDLIPKYLEQKPKLYKYRFTVFTPVYNCEKSILRVYESLKNQTFNDFEWLVINDGSTDNSHEVISEILETSKLNINYINNEINKHKMSCFIQAISLAKGEFLLPFDGDDECKPNALEFFNEEYEQTPKDLKEKTGAITVLCENQFGKLIGNEFPESPFYCDTTDAIMKKEIVGEKWGFTKTDVLRGIVINPEITNIGFVPEGIIWNLLAKSGYLTKCVNEILRVYYVGVEGSIMNTALTSKNARGVILNSIAECNWFFEKYFYSRPILFLKRAYLILRVSKLLKYPLKDYLKALDSKFIKIILVVFWPLRFAFKKI